MEQVHTGVMAELVNAVVLIHVERANQPIDLAVRIIGNQTKLLNKSFIVVAALRALRGTLPTTTIKGCVPVTATTGPQTAIVALADTFVIIGRCG